MAGKRQNDAVGHHAELRLYHSPSRIIALRPISLMLPHLKKNPFSLFCSLFNSLTYIHMEMHTQCIHENQILY